MPEQIRADGDTWRVTSDERDPGHAVRTIVFHCVSNSQRPYRVVQVAEPVLGGRDVEELGRDELNALFRRSHTMDFSHDPAARPESHGSGDPPRR
jgi:hypothetical protein